MKIINLTPHAICLNNGVKFEASGIIARVSASYEKIGETEFNGENIPVFSQVYGEIENLPEPNGDIFIVSAIVLSALAGKRDDVIAPATGHPECCRNEKGQIISVPGFVK